jgi:hypothetical protein
VADRAGGAVAGDRGKSLREPAAKSFEAGGGVVKGGGVKAAG